MSMAGDRVAALTMILCLVVSALDAHGGSSASLSHVVFTRKSTHYEVVVDFSDGVSHFDVGKDYWNAAKKAVPQFEVLLDSYLDEAVDLLADYLGRPREETVVEMMRRVSLIKPRLPADIRREIEGMTSASTAPGEPSPGDLFGSFKLQSMIFEPDGLGLWIAFKPASGGWKNVPKFEKIKIRF
ncbi:MAG: hypothetical protein AB1714_27465 [Acidobacteriota bacterium]